MGKSRLAPMKNIKIPRIEWVGAVVTCRLYNILTEELDIRIYQIHFWTDSIVLHTQIHWMHKEYLEAV
ncbi:hypothetical protein KUTeg_022192 [Tegillarca granosa]|uniref:Uncharacterized protein n=1 Tax=Tegillarca granosa TaxID=220873 RepID=A0ABQ9EBQ1_TEGGR|nr:hypothetical protein KUTeg_022192 [Tegillarca granosa]